MTTWNARKFIRAKHAPMDVGLSVVLVGGDPDFGYRTDGVWYYNPHDKVEGGDVDWYMELLVDELPE